MEGPAAVLITGASSGIGQACALRFDGLGFSVFAGVRRQSDGDALRARASSRLTPVLIDVTDVDSIAAAAEVVGRAIGPEGLRGLVASAGVVVAAPLEFLPLDELRRQLDVNVVGQLAVVQSFLPLIRRAGGRIVLMSSIAGRLPTPFVAPYAASKFALEALADGLRLELRPWGIEVVLVEPGPTATRIWERSLAAVDEMIRGLPPEAHALYGRAFPALRDRAMRGASVGIPPEQVADAVVDALTARRPRTRYLVGWHARVGAIVALLPDRLRDVLLSRTIPRYP